MQCTRNVGLFLNDRGEYLGCYVRMQLNEPIRERSMLTKLLSVLVLALVVGEAVPALAGEVTGSALGCFPNPNYPVPRPPQCSDSSGLSMYTETGGPNRDLQYNGSTFDQFGLGTFNLDLGTLTLVGAGIGSAINDDLHLVVSLADQNGDIGTADYIVSATGFAFYDSMRRQSVGQVSLDFGNPETQIFNTAFGSYALMLNVPSTPFLLTLANRSGNDGRASYDITGTLTSIAGSEIGAQALIATPEPGTMPILTMSGLLLLIGLCKQKRGIRSIILESKS